MIKLNGSYDLPWGITAAGNFNMFQGGARTLTMNGPGNVYGGVNAAGAATTISYTTLEFQDRATASGSATRRCSTWACRRVFASDRANVPGQADGGPVQRVQRQRGPDLLERQREPGGRDRAGSIIPPRVLRLGVRMIF